MDGDDDKDAAPKTVPPLPEVDEGTSSPSSLHSNKPPSDTRATESEKSHAATDSDIYLDGSAKELQKKPSQSNQEQNQEVTSNDQAGVKRNPDGLSHRQRRALQGSGSFHSAEATNEDDDTVEAIPDHFERPGAHSIPGFLGGQDDESHAVAGEEDSEGLADPGASPVVTAWVVETVAVEENEDAEDKLRDIPEAVVHEGLGGWIRGHRMLSALIIAVLVAASVTTLVVLLPSDPPIPPSAAPSGELEIAGVSERFIEALQIVETVLPGEELSYIRNLTEPQYQALTWLADEDQAPLDFQIVDPNHLIQRYALAAIYYATEGWPATRCLPFMTQFTVCEWKVAPGDDCYINDDFSDGVWTFDSDDYDTDDTGVSCDGNGYVTSLYLGKCNYV
jgi:hypothetical protein